MKSYSDPLPSASLKHSLLTRVVMGKRGARRSAGRMSHLSIKHERDQPKGALADVGDNVFHGAGPVCHSEQGEKGTRFHWQTVIYGAVSTSVRLSVSAVWTSPREPLINCSGGGETGARPHTQRPITSLTDVADTIRSFISNVPANYVHLNALW